MTALEKIVLMATLEMEASTGTDFEKQLVLDVIFNRTNQKYMSNGTLIDTCLYPLQFSSWNNGNFDNLKKIIYALQNENLYNFLNGLINYSYTTNDISDDSLLYYSPASMQPAGSKPNWNYSILEKTITTKNFIFYRLKNG